MTGAESLGHLVALLVFLFAFLLGREVSSGCREFFSRQPPRLTKQPVETRSAIQERREVR
jgi:hypothetical protein